MPPRFYCPQPIAGGQAQRLPDALAHHALRVLRLREGDAIVLFDGSGDEHEATLFLRGPEAWADVAPARVADREAVLRVTLAQALPSADKMDWIVQKATELGVAAIRPLAAERSVVRLDGERARRRVAHWRQVAVAACEQCGRNRVPEVGEVVPLRNFAGEAPLPGEQRLVLLPGAATALSALPRAARITLVVGPEGGFGEGEEQALRACGFLPVAMGRRILRTETAGAAALAVLLTLAGEF